MMRIRPATLFQLALLLALSACGGGGTSNSGNSEDSQSGGISYALTGQAQKGPFAIGSQISVNELNNNLLPTGKVYNVKTADSLGTFNVTAAPASKLVEIIGNGFYVDELSGQLSTAQIALSAIVDVSQNAKPTVNVLTSLQENRLRALLANGMTLTAANTQSQQEVLSFFGIDPANVGSFSNFYSMNISGNRDADALLLAVSILLSRMASDAAVINGTNQAAELSLLINTMAAELANAGRVTSSSINAARTKAAPEIDFQTIRSNIESYFARQGVPLVAPKFEEWIDRADSGILPQRIVAVESLSFSATANSSPGQFVTSNTASVSGIDGGVSVPVVVRPGTSIIKNGVLIIGIYSTARNGDNIALRIVAPGYGQSTIATINVGSTMASWMVKSKPLSGDISNLTSNGLILQNSGSETITIPQDATAFSFTSEVPNGSAYNVTVASQPNNQVCSVSNGSGVSGSALDNIVVNCYPTGPSSIEILSGASQSIIQHSRLQPLTVRVSDAIGKPVLSVPVTFTSSLGDSYFTPIVVNTISATPPDNSSGDSVAVASYSGYLHVAGTQTITAFLPSERSAVFTITVIPSSHQFDGSYTCNDLPSPAKPSFHKGPYPFNMQSGIITYIDPRIDTVTLHNNAFNEMTGAIVYTKQFSLNSNTDITGILVVDQFQHASGSGTYVWYSTMDPHQIEGTGSWSCVRQ